MTKEQQPSLSEKDWPEMRKLKASNKSGWMYFEHLVKTIYKHLGEEKTCEILSDLMKDNARRLLVPGMKSFGITNNDPWALASYFKLATGDVIGYKAELERVSPKKVIYRLFAPCLWFPKLDIPHTFCEAMGSFEKEAAKIINPRIKVTCQKLMTAGHSCCEFVFEEVDS